MGTSPHNLSTLLAILLGVFSLLLGCADPDVEPDSDLVTPHGALLAYHLPDGVRTSGDAHVFVIERLSKVDWTAFSEDAIWPPGVEGRNRVAFEGEGLRNALENLLPETWDAFVATNAEPQDLSKVVRFCGPVLFLTEEDIDHLFADGTDKGYSRFFQRFPDASELMAMSMPGVSKDGNQALLYQESRSGGLAGSGVYYLLVRENRLWKVVDHYMVWIA